MKIQHINIDGQQVRVAVRAGDDDGVPLLLINGIGAGLEVLQPFVDALDPGAISFSSPPRPAGPACRSCRRCGSRC
jgi:hypothetical protein